jgi:hypothetical protein
MVLHEFLARNIRQGIRWPARLTDLQPLSHLQFILIREIFHQPRDFQSLLRTLLQKFAGNVLQSEFDRVRDFAGMGTRNLFDWIRLADNKQIFDLSNIILNVLVADSMPYYQKISAIRLVPEQWRPDEIAVQHRNSLTRFYGTKLHERGFIWGL